MAVTPKSQWEYIYQSVPASQIPWETGEPSSDLIRLFREQVIKKGTKVLDVGCGLGTQTRFMAKKGAIVTGIDISETAIRKAREQMLKENLLPAGEAGIDANFVVGDICKTPFPNSSFTVVYDRGCYHHLDARERADYAKEVHRVLSPNGILQILVFAGTLTPPEVIELFLPHFEVLGAYEDIAVDRTNNNQQLPLHIVQFRKKG